MNWQDKLRTLLKEGDELKKFRRLSRMWFRRVPGSNPPQYRYSYNEMAQLRADPSGHMPKELLKELIDEIKDNDPPQSGTRPKRNK